VCVCVMCNVYVSMCVYSCVNTFISSFLTYSAQVHLSVDMGRASSVIGFEIWLSILGTAQWTCI